MVIIHSLSSDQATEEDVMPSALSWGIILNQSLFQDLQPEI